MKRFACVVLFAVLAVSACTAFALTTAEREEIYNAALAELAAYLDARESNVYALSSIREQFANAKCSHSFQFEYYTDVLVKTENGDFTGTLDTKLHTLENDESFKEYLRELDSPIGSVEKLSNYVEARRAEKEGRNDEAVSLYSSCGGFFDSSERRKNVFNSELEPVYQQGIAFMDGNLLENAYYCFRQCSEYKDSDAYAASIISELGYDPAICNGSHQNTETMTRVATCVSEGAVTVTCTVCGRTEIIKKQKDSSNHIGETKVRNEKNANCGENGYSGDAYCLACGAKISTGKEIKANGQHKWKNATYDAPRSCTVCGKTEGKPLKQVEAGDCITFGHYPQTSAGYDKTPIEWIVLDVNQNRKRTLVISKYALDCLQYNTAIKSVSWENCTLRDWLNSTFLNKAFTAKEKDAILTTIVDNSRSQGLYATDGGNDTWDKIFLMSCTEMDEYLKNDEMRKCQPTDYSLAKGAYISGGYCWWWLRSPGVRASEACRVYSNGVIYSRVVDGDSGTARPALWLDLSLVGML